MRVHDGITWQLNKSSRRFIKVEEAALIIGVAHWIANVPMHPALSQPTQLLGRRIPR